MTTLSESEKGNEKTFEARFPDTESPGSAGPSAAPGTPPGRPLSRRSLHTPPAHPVQRTAVLCSIIFPLDLLLFLSPENILPSPSPPVPDHPGMTSCRCHTARRPMNIRFPRSRQSVRHKHLTKKHTLYLLTGVIPVPREFVNPKRNEKPDPVVVMQRFYAHLTYL